jgi:hypothetical protein
VCAVCGAAGWKARRSNQLFPPAKTEVTLKFHRHPTEVAAPKLLLRADHGPPELIPRFLGEFETCPDWVPGMDTARPSASMMMKTKSVHGFDHTASRVAKVRNVSYLESQIQWRSLIPRIPLAASSTWR